MTAPTPPPVDPAAMDDATLDAYYEAMDADDQAQKTRLEAPDALAGAACWYASVGIPVFPLRPGGKLPLHAKAHPDHAQQKACRGSCGQDGHGLYDATTDLGRVERWWATTPQANIGLPTGHLFDIVDIDGAPGMRVYIDQLVHGACPRRPGTDVPSCCDHGHDCHGDGHTIDDLTGGVLAVVRTGGDNGGLHLYVRPTGDPNGTHLMPGIDYRGLGGYVVAPPSRGARGRYIWREPLDPQALQQPTSAA